jgi:hypothetical protein
MEVVAPQGCRRTNEIAKNRHVFLAGVTCLETAEEALEAVYNRDMKRKDNPNSGYRKDLSLGKTI